ncbi:tRNA(His) guanylyltransferase Thg1 family protein [Nannocystis punicea]|uniref:tRNA(His) guanylyltransferase n=1 Tax=Nannocystis punicea TaxID=2995304 RepID=A0ABY7H7N7_9BACT|nr:tRNA(His) guanylyltransferase Thg1 family protein [Nannocystis poenicansa]WAS95281.1 guanylyltransferase [Nannocystis poenicansa]
MKSDDLSGRLRPFETASDRRVPPGFHMVARLDGRGFSQLTKERLPELARPYDVRVRDMMIDTARHLMQCGFQVVYAYTQSDEISLLFHPRERAFGRLLRKYHSILAGEASAKFSLLLGQVVCFDCRVAELPDVDRVVDYFRWRADDAARNCLNAHCYWALRAAGRSEGEATAALAGLGPDARHELLFRAGTHFAELPAWQRRGVGLAWTRDADERPWISPDLELPMRADYEAYVRAKLVEPRREAPADATHEPGEQPQR